MRKYTILDNSTMMEWGLTIQEGYLFEWMSDLPNWAESMDHENETYFFASKNKACSDLPLLTEKPDTMYRYYKKIQSKGIIKIHKFGGKDYILITEKGLLWNSDKNPNSENYPNQHGQSSELGRTEIRQTDTSITESENTGGEIIQEELFPVEKTTKSENILEEIKSIENFTKKNWTSILLKYSCDELHVEDWAKVKTRKRSQFTKSSLILVVNTCLKNDIKLKVAAKTCAEQGWAGFKYEWYKNLKPEEQQEDDGSGNFMDKKTTINNLK